MYAIMRTGLHSRRHCGGPEVDTIKASYLSAHKGPANTKSSTSLFAHRTPPHLFFEFFPLSLPSPSLSPPSVRAMDLGAPRRGRLPIHLLLASLTVLVVLTVHSSAEVITLTEETFSDKVTPAVPFSATPPYLVGDTWRGCTFSVLR